MSSFNERQKHLFTLLKDIEEQIGFSKYNKASNDQDFGIIDTKSYKKLKQVTKQFRGKESIFKRQEPDKLGIRPKNIPDYFKNPHKWTYYTLSDVTPEQMSDETNAATALAVLKGLEQEEFNKLKQETKMTDDSLFKKPKFCVSATVKSKKDKDEKACVTNSKIIMPEYFVGKSTKKSNNDGKRQYTKNLLHDGNNGNIKLDHLFDGNDSD